MRLRHSKRLTNEKEIKHRLKEASDLLGLAYECMDDAVGLLAAALSEQTGYDIVVNSPRKHSDAGNIDITFGQVHSLDLFCCKVGARKFVAETLDPLFRDSKHVHLSHVFELYATEEVCKKHS